MSTGALDVVEFLLTTSVYSDDRTLDENDLPPSFRRVFWTGAGGNASDEDGSETTDRHAGISRPLSVTTTAAREATDIDQPWSAVSDLLFTERDEFSGTLSLTQQDMAEEWFFERVDEKRLLENPTLAKYFEEHDEYDVDVGHEAARERNRPIQADRVWIDGLLEEYFDDEEDEEMLDLVDVRAPEEVETTLDDLVLTDDQENELDKIAKAIEHRDYLSQIGLREIGKLLFVGPPGTGKTSTAQALAQEMDLPFVEVKLSMITSQYLGETAKNVDKTFEVAKRLSPCILFIDEFDFVAKTRRSDEHAALKRAVNTLLKSIDNISLIEDDVLLIGATNHPDQLDDAAWRRFDEIINFPKPDEGMRADILGVITRQMDIEEFDPQLIAEATAGLTGSDLRMVLREAVLEALTEDRTTLTQNDLREAIEEFEERDNLKNMDMIEGDHDALVAGGDIGKASDGSGHSHDHDHTHDHDPDH
ncbi:ATP-binding protein [Natronobacterium gregoryi]|uniref:AAA+ family ATPase n=2 Tax=Natronobacterium gregoryi TaxID=44930 RepID=L0AH28_NATGS|nr:ATP-binding protein [Natronobacterium gregoryi]AFZ73091.1 AAA+ family ATPase [Natronobacterium gregoryi SP2]ELY70810.1 ATPase AAA [Natronobacterium gregoryi SP2]PLK20389.1 ATP-binding protein [Natronobacterium gregoryi SP2]SFI61363.1 ATPase family associated with various cellular activities (AAA) [Natronobacterium gregoryi]